MSVTTSLTTVSLDDYLPANSFRLITEDQLSLPPGYGEIKVRIEFSDLDSAARYLPSFANKSTVNCGFVTENSAIKNIFTGDMAQLSERRRIYLVQAGPQFILRFEEGSHVHRKEFLVPLEQAKCLLSNCCVPPI